MSPESSAEAPDKYDGLRRTISDFNPDQLARRSSHLKGEMDRNQELINELYTKQADLSQQYRIVVNQWVEATRQPDVA